MILVAERLQKNCKSNFDDFQKRTKRKSVPLLVSRYCDIADGKNVSEVQHAVWIEKYSTRCRRIECHIEDGRASG